ncbi:MAG TPA: carbon-phosphorus lyase complex subunit PhnI [Candidatus Dormibacteraeota bacterium]|jgi:alpha-D-ribose 1-methylphosphonate 5-triphosphate synthase subunit PhnI|nr:carbon-phosphorus lyase complex subunit PhnI [Candidatus Dormibacteraeota bacterium]
MGYTTVLDRSGAVGAAALLAESQSARAGGGFASGLLVDQVMAEAGVVEPGIARLALDQADGDLARAVSLIRAWSAVLPRHAPSRAGWEELVCRRRITPGFAGPRGGQYLGASRDYAQRLLDLSPLSQAPVEAEESEPVPEEPTANGHQAPSSFPRATGSIDREGLVAEPRPRAGAQDVTRTPAHGYDRGVLLQLLSRAESGALVALGYTGIRGNGRQDPTLLELRSGTLPVRMRRPGGGTFTLGQVPAVLVEMGGYRLHGGQVDAALTIGVGATPGRLERRAIAAAVLDAGCARAATDPPDRREPCEDAEFLTIALDGQEASGFVEHLKLPHHVTFTSELDRIRQARSARRVEPSAS